jgi:hypothetical protein
VTVTAGTEGGGTAAGSPIAGVADADAAEAAETTEEPAKTANAEGELDS